MIDPTVFIHEQALVEEKASIGARTRVWAFSHILSGAKIGSDCNICDHVFIENNVYIGDRVTIKSGVQLWNGVNIDEDVFIGPNVTFTNDKYPRSRKYPENVLTTYIRKGATVGANATLLPGIVIGSGAMVGAGAVVTKDVPSKAIVVGNPARITGYSKTHTRKLEFTDDMGKFEQPKVNGVCLRRFKHVKDLRGDLTALEWDTELPFTPNRSFFVFNVPSGDVRGEHAHKTCHQLLCCIGGSVNVVVDDGQNREEFVLNNPEFAIYIPPAVWGTQYKYSTNAILYVLASHKYDADDYIRDYEDYLTFLKS